MLSVSSSIKFSLKAAAIAAFSIGCAQAVVVPYLGVQGPNPDPFTAPTLQGTALTQSNAFFLKANELGRQDFEGATQAADPALAAAHAHLTGARVNGAVTEDTLAYFRDTHEFRNGTLAELPHHGPLAGTAAAVRDYATTIVRNFLYSALMVLLWERLEQSTDERLAAIAAKSLKEVRYHLRHSRDWLLRLGDGTDESHRRTQAALDHLLPHTQEFWTTTAAETQAAANGAGVEPQSLKPDWEAIVHSAVAEATLTLSATTGYVTQGKHGVHSEHLGFVLAEMQSLARTHPQARW